MIAYIADWADLLLRWLHIITGIAWIGSSFYFIWLDLSLRRRQSLPQGVHGESWSVHGGGFYHVQKYLVAPPQLPGELHWFKYESYFTWLSGFALLGVVYYYGAQSFLIDPAVMDIGAAEAIMISLASLALGWVLYDRLCRSALGEHMPLLGALVFLMVVLAAWGYGEVFSGRAALLHVGALVATIMTGNVFFIIIPNQKIVVADLRAGRTPDPKYGKIAKQRSTHNNYLTLPVLFMMISNHYPMVTSAERLWLVAALVVAIGATVRAWFNASHEGRSGMGLMWQWPVAGVLTVVLAALVYVPPPTGADARAAVTDTQALTIVLNRCAGCHAQQPVQPGFTEAAGGIRLESIEQLKVHGDAVYTQSVAATAMPLANLTGMTDAERAQLGAWLRNRR